MAIPPKIVVDSNVLLDVLTEDEQWFDWSSSTLSEVARKDILVINPLIYAEVSLGFERIEDLGQDDGSHRATGGQQGILGHFHVQTNKNDPGPAFDWEPFLARVREELARPAPTGTP